MKERKWDFWVAVAVLTVITIAVIITIIVTWPKSSIIVAGVGVFIVLMGGWVSVMRVLHGVWPRLW